MKQKSLLNGIQAIVEGSIYSGCRYFFGNTRPCTKDVISYVSERMPEVNGVFLPTEDEESAVAMCIGAASAGNRVLTATSSDGLNLMKDGISYLYYERIPSVIACVTGDEVSSDYIIPNQNAYNYVVKGWQNFRLPVFCPVSVEDSFNIMTSAFNMADKYRIPVIVLTDLILGYMKEVIETESELLPLNTMAMKEWTIGGARNRLPRVLAPAPDNAVRNKQKEMIIKESRFWSYNLENAKKLIIAHGSLAYIIRDLLMKTKDTQTGIFAPVSLYPFPVEALYESCNNKKKIIVLEMNEGQMLDDVKMILESKKIPVSFSNVDYTKILKHDSDYLLSLV